MITFNQFLTERNLKLTLQYHEALNPALWNGDKLKPEIRMELLRQAKLFCEFAAIPQKAIKDIIFTGSNANKNYTKFSDCDVHIITDETHLDSNHLYDKKIAWQLKHKNLKVAGYPIEFFAQDMKEQLPGDQGQFSLQKNQWNVHPPAVLAHSEILRDPLFLKKVSYYIHNIQKLILTRDTAGIRNLKDQFYRMRSSGLQKAGEFSYENSLYKELRNRNWISKMSKLIKSIE